VLLFLFLYPVFVFILELLVRGRRTERVKDVELLVVHHQLEVLRLQTDLPQNCCGSTPKPTRFELCMRSKLFAITTRTPSRRVPVAVRSREEPEPFSLAGEHDQWRALHWVAHGRVSRSTSARGRVGVP
jgi:hypothetical protein